MAILPPETLSTLVDYASLFGIGFASVFLMGFQSRNVNHGNYGWAAGTSLFVGFGQALVWRHITADQGTLAVLVYALSGALGITSSMYVHERFVKRVQ